MRLAIIGLGRMDANIAHRLMRGGNEIVGYDRNEAAVAELEGGSATSANSLEDVATKLKGPRISWVMLPAGQATENTIAKLAELAWPCRIISSWLLDLSAAALAKNHHLDTYTSKGDDSGEGQWKIDAAMEEAVPVYVLSAALFARYRGRVDTTFGDKLLSAMRYGFGGHIELPR